MPYKSGTIIIAKTKFDRRIKLTEDDKKLIVWLREEEQLSNNQLATQFNVSRRTIQFILDPKKLEENKKRRAERGGTKIYYDKEKHREAIKDTRNYKKKLYLEKLITI